MMRIKWVEDEWSDGSIGKWCLVNGDTVTEAYDHYIDAWRVVKYLYPIHTCSRMMQVHLEGAI